MPDGPSASTISAAGYPLRLCSQGRSGEGQAGFLQDTLKKSHWLFCLILIWTWSGLATGCKSEPKPPRPEQPTLPQECVPQQLGELSPGTAPSHPTHPVPVGTRLFFRANDGVHGTDSWVSDGTEAGTILVKDLNPSLGTANIWPMTGVQDRLLFTVTTAPDKYELWSSDGTEAGTWYLGPINSYSGTPFVVLEGQLYFVRGSSLWSTDGTEANTREVHNFGGGSMEVMSLRGAPFIIQRWVGAQLWTSDGTEAGTTLVAHLPGSIPEVLTTQDHLFLHYVDFSVGAELWSSDGTAGGDAPPQGHRARRRQLEPPLSGDAGQPGLLRGG